MTANIYRNDIMTYEDGHSWVESYTDDTHYTISDEAFGGTGSFYIENGLLHWVNNQTGENTVFVRAWTEKQIYILITSKEQIHPV